LGRGVQGPPASEAPADIAVRQVYVKSMAPDSDAISSMDAPKTCQSNIDKALADHYRAEKELKEGEASTTTLASSDDLTSTSDVPTSQTQEHSEHTSEHMATTDTTDSPATDETPEST
ncbi:hypothetical protein PMAYCL1PPCAC_28455, partial [Pristionchus mayeri]